MAIDPEAEFKQELAVFGNEVEEAILLPLLYICRRVLRWTLKIPAGILFPSAICADDRDFYFCLGG